MIFVTGIGLAFFLAVLLLIKKQKEVADWILFCWLLFTGIHISAYYFLSTGILYQFPAMLGIGLPFPTLHGPFLFLYVNAVIHEQKGFARKNTWHFVPTLLDYALLVPFLLLPTEKKIEVFQQGGKGYEYFVWTNNILISASGIFYSLVTLYQLYQSYSKPMSLTRNTRIWLVSLAAFIVGIWMVVLLNFNDEYIFTGALVFVYYIGFAGISRAGVFATPLPAVSGQSGPTPVAMQDPISEALGPKYAKSGLQDGTADELHQALVAIMQEKQPYRNAELTLADLAKALDTHPNYLSQVINEKEGMNFYEYINQSRLKAFQQLAMDPAKQQYTLLALAYESGFNSKSSFNRYFKKATGTSPSSWLQEQNGLFDSTSQD